MAWKWVLKNIRRDILKKKALCIDVSIENGGKYGIGMIFYPTGDGVIRMQRAMMPLKTCGSCSPISDGIGVTVSHPDTYARHSVKGEHEPNLFSTTQSSHCIRFVYWSCFSALGSINKKEIDFA
jgi:hypothetical protein